MSQSQSDNDSPMEISVKNTNRKKIKKGTIQALKPKRKQTKKKLKLKSQMMKKLKDRLEQEQYIKQLQAIPANFGIKETKIINLQEKVKQEKPLKHLGIKLVHQPKKIYKQPIDRLKIHSEKANNLRGNFSHILIKKAIRNQ